MKRFLSLLLIFVVFTGSLSAQEFNCRVQINTQQVQGFDQNAVTDLQKAMTEFINNRKWTSLTFQTSEKIECTLLFTVSKIVSNDQFTGTFHWVLERPVYGSSYRSALLNMVDKDIQFKYVPSQNMNIVAGTFTNNLTSLLAYYVYMMLGIDFDTFSLNGGHAFYQQAMSIVQSAQNSSEPGWKLFEGEKNRYQFAEQLLNSAYDPLHEFLYQYFRKGMDMMYHDADQGRRAILEAMPTLTEVYNKRPGLYILQLILDARRDELIKIFTQAPTDEKNKLIEIVSQIDPANGGKYRDALSQN